MADNVSIDASDLFKLAAQIGTIADELPKGAVKAVAVSAMKGKAAWVKSLQGSAVPASGSTIDYTVTDSGGSVEAVISSSRGSERLRGFVQAREYGSPTVAPAGDAQRALDSVADDFAYGMGLAGERAIKRALGAT